VSRFFKFPIQMNFAENKKWPASPFWRATYKNSLGGYVRGDLGPARVQGVPQGRLLDKRRGEGVVVRLVGLLKRSGLDEGLPVRAGFGSRWVV
jgi:hypothetical protein